MFDELFESMGEMGDVAKLLLTIIAVVIIVIVLESIYGLGRGLLG